LLDSLLQEIVMSCYNCTKDFSLFNRETACANCGFGFCSSCLKYKVVIPNKGPKEQRACRSCHLQINSPEEVKKSYYAPPEALQKRLDNLQPAGGKPAVTVYKDRDKMKNLRRGMSSDDQKLVDRLEKLHRERKELTNLPSEQEVRNRLEKLKGFSSAPPPDNSRILLSKDTRSRTEQSHDLMSALTAEVELDNRTKPALSPESDIASRLAKLKGEQPVDQKANINLPDPAAYLANFKEGDIGGSDDIDEVVKLIESVNKNAKREAEEAMNELEKDKAIKDQLERLKVKTTATVKSKEYQFSDDDDNEENQQKAILKQILAEQELESRLEELEVVDGDDLPSGEPGELPWCVICNADAVLRCHGCDGDLYCQDCFKECHEGEDLREHRTDKFVKK